MPETVPGETVTEGTVPEETASDAKRSLTTRAEPASLERVHLLLESLWEDCPDVAPVDRMLFATAVAEIAGNIAQHASDGSPLEFSLDLAVYADRLEAQFRDTGRRAEVDLANAEMPADLAESGRGLAMTLAAVDELQYRRDHGVNHWQIVRRRMAR